MRKEFLVFLVVVFLVGSCKRNGSQEEVQNGLQTVTAKAQLWLEAQRKANQPFSDKIRLLSDHVEWPMAKTESYANRNLLVVPIKPGYLTLNNKGKNPANYLVLFLNHEEEVTGGRIVQYVSPKAKAGIPEKAIVKILNNEDPGCEGSFSFTNIVDRFLYELKFASGKKTDFVYMAPRVGKSQESNKTQSLQCHDWYLITTHYNPDGTVEVWEDYLGRTCDGCTPASPDMEASLCDDFQDGAGGGLGEECCMIGSNVSFQTSSESVLDNTVCGAETFDVATGKWTKTCIYTWTYNTSNLLWSTWTYSSIEVGELEKVGKPWLFKTLTHSGKRKEGTSPACIEFTDEITRAVSSISADRRLARMDLEYWIQGKPTCVPFATADKRIMTAYANFNAGF